MSLLNSMLGGAAQGLGGSLLQQQQEDMLAQRYQNALAQSMLQAQQNAAAQTLQGAYTTKISTFDPNKSEAFQVPLSQLVTLWQAKFNDTWVDMGIEHEDFWRQAHRRLNNADKFESVEGWVRLLEDA
jgi:hypothetical protein